jgi:hypothetical protein
VPFLDAIAEFPASPIDALRGDETAIDNRTLSKLQIYSFRYSLGRVTGGATGRIPIAQFVSVRFLTKNDTNFKSRN